MTTDSNPEQPWLRFTLEGVVDGGVDARSLSQLLWDIAGAARVIADDMLSISGRRGRMTREERALAALRVTSVLPGSLRISFAEPPPIEVRQLAFDATPPAPGDVAQHLVSELVRAARGEEPVSGAYSRRRAIDRVLRSAGRIATTASVTHLSPDGEVHEAHFSLATGDVRAPEPQPVIEQRVLFGHVYMADVEMGRERLRVKLPNEKDLTLDVTEDLRGELASALDQLVELSVSEARLGDEVVERVVGSFRLLEADERGDDSPPSSVHDLAREQGLFLRPQPDYEQLARDLWETESDEAAFREYVRRTRAEAS